MTDAAQFVADIGTAALLGGAIGLERQWHQGLAGLRTNTLVAIAACGFVHLPQAIGATGMGPANIAGYVISGIGFLGAGVILREGMNVRGLNTAATLWGTAAVGVYGGAGLKLDAALLASMILFINVTFRPLLMRVNWLRAHLPNGAPVAYVGTLICADRDHQAVRDALVARCHKAGLSLRSLSSRPSPDTPGSLNVRFELVSLGIDDRMVEEVLSSFSSFETVCSLSWSRADSAEQDAALHVGS